MKRIVLIFLSLCLLTLPAPVQGGVRFSPKKIVASIRKVVTPKRSKQAKPSARPARLQKPANFKTAQSHLRTLNARVERTIDQAVQAKRSATHRRAYFLQHPVKPKRKLTAIPFFYAKEIYPDKLFLQDPTLEPWLTESYFAAQNNRWFAKYLRDMEVNFWPAFEAAKPRFFQEAQAFKQPENLVEWTVEQITPAIKNLFIGEIHGRYEIAQFISQLLPHLRKQNPDRPIFLFAEFLRDLEGKEAPLEQKVIVSRHDHQRAKVWETAQQLDISLVGLESDKFPSSYPLRTVDDFGTPLFNIPAGATLEGMRLRNDHWWKIMQAYRQQNPDALFIVYTGKAHALYNFPSSLAKRTPKETTLLLDLMTETFQVENTRFQGKSTLELLDAELSFPQRVLKWSSPDLIELSGFDISIKLPSVPYTAEMIKANYEQFEKFNKYYKGKRLR